MKQTGEIHVAPNIQNAPDIYEIENLAADPDRLIESAMWEIQPWDGRNVLDIGAGTGFHLPRFLPAARHVIGLEPHLPSLRIAHGRIETSELERVSLVAGSAATLPVSDQSIDIAHARFAYFFAPDCEPGVRELERVMRPGGAGFIIENDLRSGTFADWLKRSPWVEHDLEVVEGFWRDHGFSIIRIQSRWSFQSREDLESVVRIEFPSDIAEQIIAGHNGTEVDYHYLLIWRRYGTSS